MSPDYGCARQCARRFGAGNYQPGETLSTGHVRSLVASDLDDDGNDDLIGINWLDPEGPAPAHDVSVFFGAGDGGFEEIIYLDSAEPESCCPFAVRIADIDGDARSDVVLGHGAYVITHRNRGNRSLDTPRLSPLPGPLHSLYPSTIVPADLDGDGWLDLTTLTGIVLRNRGDGAFSEARNLHTKGAQVIPADLDGDGRLDLVIGGAVFLNPLPQPRSRDEDGNGIPDECEGRAFHRGDPNSSGDVDDSDGIAIFGHLFLGNPATLSCRESADSNNDATIDISDGIYLLSWLFTGGPEPVAPGPTDRPCGPDPGGAGSLGDLGCAEYAACP